MGQLTGSAAGLPAWELNLVAVNYLVQRAIYNYMYLRYPSGFKALRRTFAYWLAVMPLMLIFLQS